MHHAHRVCGVGRLAHPVNEFQINQLVDDVSTDERGCNPAAKSMVINRRGEVPLKLRLMSDAHMMRNSSFLLFL